MFRLDAAQPSFQSTLPARGATSAAQIYTSFASRFQSTLPARGATACHTSGLPLLRHFNPRSPHGERLADSLSEMAQSLISIHAPRTGSDHGVEVAFQQGGISIHAPRTGSDHITSSIANRPRNFNPRSPHGERHKFPGALLADAEFQSTLPARGATPRGCHIHVGQAISIHAPRTGSDARHGFQLTRTLAFQSTLPARGATAF